MHSLSCAMFPPHIDLPEGAAYHRKIVLELLG